MIIIPASRKEAIALHCQSEHRMIQRQLLERFSFQVEHINEIPAVRQFFAFLHIPYPLFKRNPVENSVDATVGYQNLIESFDTFRESFAALLGKDRFSVRTKKHGVETSLQVENLNRLAQLRH